MDGYTLQVSKTEQQGIPVVSVQGWLDHATTPQLSQFLHQLIDEGNYRIVLELNCNHISSPGIKLLYEIRKLTKSHGGDVRLVCTVPYTVARLELVGLDVIFGMYENVQNAVESFISVAS